jgi:large subunit ribosomal protein L10
MLTKEQKLQMSEELRANLSSANTVFLLENAGLKVNEINQLRAKLHDTDATYRVVKNSVVRLAIDGTPLQDIGPFLIGPKALAYTPSDGVELGKILKDFIKTHPALSFKEAIMEGQVLDSGQAEAIASLPTKDELISKLLYVLQSPMRRLAVALNGPIQNLASVVNQIAEKKES